VLEALSDTMRAENVAFLATLLCVWIAAFGAFRIPAQSPRLFSALALFGLTWGLLLLYYLPGPPQQEILAAFSGFTLVYVGVLLTREGRERRDPRGEPELGWGDRLPLYLLRPTVGGFGVYLLVHRVFHAESGWGTLAVALWGTLLTVVGYGAIWFGLASLYADHPSLRRVRIGMGLLLTLYSGCEVAYAAWYAGRCWPVYRRYLLAQNRRDAPDFEARLPFRPQSDWPEADRWRALQASPDWPGLAGALELTVQPHLPEMPAALKYAFSALKLIFTVTFLTLIWRRPGPASDAEADGPRPAPAPASGGKPLAPATQRRLG
jgi:hypothetical protein